MNGSQTIKHGHIPKHGNKKDNHEGGGQKEDGFSDDSVREGKCCRVSDMKFHRIGITTHSSCCVASYTQEFTSKKVKLRIISYLLYIIA